MKYKNVDQTLVDAVIDGVLYENLNLYASATIPEAVLAWINDGHTPEPYTPPTPEEKLAAAGLTVDELKTLVFS